MQQLEKHFNDLKYEVLGVYSMIHPLIVDDDLREMVEERHKQISASRDYSLDELMTEFRQIDAMFELLMMLKNNEKYVQEAADQSPSIHDLNTNAINAKLTEMAYLLFQFTLLSEPETSDPDLRLIVEVQQRVIDTDEAIEELLPGSSSIFDDRNYTMMIFGDKLVEESSLPKSTTKIGFNIPNTANMVYDFGMLVDEAKVRELGIRVGQGLDAKVVERFRNFYKLDEAPCKEVVETGPPNDSLYLLEGSMGGKNYYRKVSDYADWDTTSCTKHSAIMVFESDMENKRLIMNKSNAPKKYKRKLVTDKAVGDLKNAASKTRNLASVVFDYFYPEVSNDSGALRLITICSEIAENRAITSSHKYLSDKRNLAKIDLI